MSTAYFGNTTSTSYVPPQENLNLTDQYGLWNKGDQIGFFSHDHNWDLPDDITDPERVIKQFNFFVIRGFDLNKNVMYLDHPELQNWHRRDDFKVGLDYFASHQALTREQVLEKLKEHNKPHSKVCSKVRELYRKFNKQNHNFKFQGV
jgi:hypothetical protein